MNILISFRCMCSIYLWRNKPNSIKLDLLEGIVEDGYDYKCEFVNEYILKLYPKHALKCKTFLYNEYLPDTVMKLVGSLCHSFKYRTCPWMNKNNCGLVNAHLHYKCALHI